MPQTPKAPKAPRQASKAKAAPSPDATAALSKRLTALEDRISKIELALGSSLGISL